MKEKSMFQKYKDKEITGTEYNNYRVQKLGFGSYIAYRDWLARNNGLNSHAEYKQQYRNTHKEQIIKYKSQWLEDHPEFQKQYYENNKKQIIEKQKQYYQSNKEVLLEKMKQYNQLHKEQITESNNKWIKSNPEYYKQYYQNNRERLLESGRQWYKDHPEHGKQYYQTPNGKISRKTAIAKRKRELGYDIINKNDINNLNYVGHHLDKINVLYIPEELHNSIRHKQSDKKSMQKINSAAINWYIKQKGINIKW